MNCGCPYQNVISLDETVLWSSMNADNILSFALNYSIYTVFIINIVCIDVFCFSYTTDY